MRSTFCEAKLMVHKSSSLLPDDDDDACGAGCDNRIDISSAGSCNISISHTSYYQQIIIFFVDFKHDNINNTDILITGNSAFPLYATS